MRQMTDQLQDLIEGQNKAINHAAHKKAPPITAYAPAAEQGEAQRASTQLQPDTTNGDGLEQTLRTYMIGSYTHQSANYDPVGYYLQSSGLLFGLNTAVVQNWTVGVSGFYGKGALDFTGEVKQNRSDNSDVYAGSLQAVYTFGATRFGVNTLYLHTRNKHGNQSNLSTETGSYNTNSLSTGLSLQVEKNVNGQLFISELTLNHVWFQQDRFTTAGQGALIPLTAR